jgi:GDP-L-fucose synthase
MATQRYSLRNKRVYVAGHRGLVGQAIVRRLALECCTVIVASRDELDLRDPQAVNEFFARETPNAVFLAAAKVGGIVANNTLRADFLYENLMIAANVIHAAHETKTEKLLFLGSTCIYPKYTDQPMNEDSLLTGPLEPTNEPYAIAKIAGVKLAEAYRDQYGDDFISVMPTNLYGPGDNYHSEHSHVVAALIQRFHEAKESGAPSVMIWGTGTSRREFLYVDDMADACVFAMTKYSDRRLLNIGTGKDIAISDFATLVATTVGYQGKITYDLARPDGTPLKRVDVTRMNNLGWHATTKLEDGLQKAYDAFLDEKRSHRLRVKK